jgi:radical SAM superfamily enzyme YgiQ (UPF0313 family)
MRIHFIFPRWQKLLEAHPELKDELSGFGIGSFRMASLGIPTAIAALPPGVEHTFHDENLGPVDLDVEADLVALGFFTPQAGSAYRIADAFRARGVPTLAGGIHASMAPEDTLRHFDAIVVGEVEGVWPRVLGDLERGVMRGTYRRATLPPALDQQQPRRDVFEPSRYLRTGVIQISRGCRYGCGYCIIPRTYGQTIRYRPVAEVLADIESLPYSSYYIADESLVFTHETDRAYANELLDALAEAKLRKVFYIAASPWMMEGFDEAFVRRLAAAGCRQIYAVFGLDQPLKRELGPALVERLHALLDARIEVMGSFILGNDGDDASCRELILGFCAEAKLNLAELAIMTPFPGTPQFAQMKREGRLLHEDWGLYNCANVVFQPKHFTVDELSALYLDLWRTFYKDLRPLEVKRRYVRVFSRDILDSDAW